MLELYHSGLTTCSKQVRHCLREKGLKYESRYVELWRYENLSPDYLKLNPNGVVPTLVHDGTPIINSFCINEYIEDAFPEPPLRPADPRSARACATGPGPRTRSICQLARLTHASMLQARVKDLSPADQQIMLKSTPVPEKRERWRRADQGRLFRRAACDGARQRAVRVRPHGGGACRSAGRGSPARPSRSATSACSPSCIASSSSIPTGSTARRFRALNDWWDRAMARPAAKYVYSDGTDEVPPRPPTKSVAGIAEYRV